MEVGVNIKLSEEDLTIIKRGILTYRSEHHYTPANFIYYNKISKSAYYNLINGTSCKRGILEKLHDLGIIGYKVNHSIEEV